VTDSLEAEKLLENTVDQSLSETATFQIPKWSMSKRNHASTEAAHETQSYHRQLSSLSHGSGIG
jgi:hypothetical protein